MEVTSFLGNLPKSLKKRYGGLLKPSLFTLTLLAYIYRDDAKTSIDNIVNQKLETTYIDVAIQLCTAPFGIWRRDLISLLTNVRYSFLSGIYLSQSRAGMPEIAELCILPISPGVFFLIKEYIGEFFNLIKRLCEIILWQITFAFCLIN